MERELNLGGDDDGWADVSIGSGDSKVSQRLDVFAVQNQLFELSEQAKAQGLSAKDRNENIAKLMQQLGFPPVSHFIAFKFEMAIGKLTEELEKKVGTGGSDLYAKSPDSTASTPASGQPQS